MEGSTKNGRSRQIILSPALRGVLLGYRWWLVQEAAKRRRDLSPYLFVNEQGQLLHPDTFTKRLRKIYAANGFPASTPCVTSSSPLCCTAASTSRPWQNWPVIVTRAFWNVPIAIPRWSAKRTPPHPCSPPCTQAMAHSSRCKWRWENNSSFCLLGIAIFILLGYVVFTKRVSPP